MTDNLSLSCPECGKTYQRARSLASHREHEHGIPVPSEFKGPKGKITVQTTEERITQASAEYRLLLTLLADLLGLSASTRADAQVIRDNIDAAVASMGQAAGQYPPIAYAIHRAVAMSGLLFVAAAHAPIIKAIWQNHRNPEIAAQREEVAEERAKLRTLRDEVKARETISGQSDAG